MTLPKAAQSISRVPPTTGRMEPCTLPNGAVVLRDDFNGSLDTFIVAFEALKAAKAARKILVITTVGDSPESWDRRTMRVAREAASVVQMLVLVGKTKDTKRAGKAALNEGLSAENLFTFEDLRELAAFLKSTLRLGDLMLLRGRTTDHITRVFHAQTREVSCWKTHCTERNLCDHCSELFGKDRPREAPEPRSA
jgi:UDP-N-acetylmuramoyl-tripeptide--D-alanyl-D-alanine ligase